ncbi:helix-turn-helix transcriptional regulator [Streptomyces sp. NPDC059076]|uniref:helix-turn-helix domain-containing protein n=1 Tax=unclassified Streptomyces TaxID=2593676 RepID=UPI0036BDC692
MTHRQVQLLILAANGHTNRAIAKKRGITEDTVKSQLQVIYRKLRVSDRAQAVAVALVIGLLTTSDVHVPEGVVRPGPRRAVRRVTPKAGL